MFVHTVCCPCFHCSELRECEAEINRLKQEVQRLSPKPAQTWRDVTAECEVDHAVIKHGDIDIHTAQWFAKGSYRLRKVQFWATADGPLAKPHDAFIVEHLE